MPQRLGMVAGVAFPCDLQTIKEWLQGAWSARGHPQNQDLSFNWPWLPHAPLRSCLIDSHIFC